MRTRPFFAALLCIASIARADDVTLSEGSPADIHMSPAVLRSGVGLFEEAVARDDLIGAVVLVAREGKIVLHEAIGFRDPKKTQPLKKDALFHMASNTKAVTAAATLILVDRNKVKLDESVWTYLPAFDTPRSQFILVRHLLTHTSGMRIGGLFVRPPLKEGGSLQAEVNRFGPIGATDVPGTRYRYSNPGYNTLGAIIEVASGDPLEGFFTREIYQPLGMSDTCNHFDEAKRDRQVPVFRKKSDEPWAQASVGADDPTDYRFVRASGGMVSTAADFARFCQMTLNGGVYGGKRILSEASAKAWSTREEDTPSWDGADRGAKRYGFGWHVEADGSLSHTGSDGTFAWVDFERRIIGIVLTQNTGGKNPRDQFRRVVEAACEDRPTTPVVR